jgi:hypothetical protein
MRRPDGRPRQSKRLVAAAASNVRCAAALVESTSASAGSTYGRPRANARTGRRSWTRQTSPIVSVVQPSTEQRDSIGIAEGVPTPRESYTFPCPTFSTGSVPGAADPPVRVGIEPADGGAGLSSIRPSSRLHRGGTVRSTRLERGLFRLATLSLVAAALAVSAPAAEAAGFAPGAPGLGDPFYPNAGNGGYDVAHYSLALAYEPSSDLRRRRPRQPQAHAFASSKSEAERTRAALRQLAGRWAVAARGGVGARSARIASSRCSTNSRSRMRRHTRAKRSPSALRAIRGSEDLEPRTP